MVLLDSRDGVINRNAYQPVSQSPIQVPLHKLQLVELGARMWDIWKTLGTISAPRIFRRVSVVKRGEPTSLSIFVSTKLLLGNQIRQLRSCTGGRSYGIRATTLNLTTSPFTIANIAQNKYAPRD